MNRKCDLRHAIMAGYVTSYSDLTWTVERIRTKERERDGNFNFKIGREKEHFLYLGLVLAVLWVMLNMWGLIIWAGFE